MNTVLITYIVNAAIVTREITWTPQTIACCDKTIIVSDTECPVTINANGNPEARPVTCSCCGSTFRAGFASRFTDRSAA